MTQLSTSQVVELHAFVMSVMPMCKRKEKDVIEVILAGSKKVTLNFDFWGGTLRCCLMASSRKP